MSDDKIVSLAKERDDRRLVWVCRDCGCTSHYLYANGQTECVGCGLGSTDADENGWRERLPAAPETALPLPDEAYKVVPLAPPVTFLKRRLKEEDAEDITIAVIGYKGGNTATYWDHHGEKTPESEAFVTKLLDSARRRILGK